MKWYGAQCKHLFLESSGYSLSQVLDLKIEKPVGTQVMDTRDFSYS